MSHVIVPLDGSELAERALPLAVHIAALTASDVRLVQAPLAPASLAVGSGVGLVMDAGHEYLDDQEAKLRERYSVATTARTAISMPAELILAEAGGPGVSAIVMSTHGRSGLLRTVLGSVAEHVVRESPVPVFLLPAAAGHLPERPRILHVLVPLDGSALAYSIMGTVPGIARRAGASLRLLRVFAEEEDRASAPGHWDSTVVEHQLNRLEDKAHAYFRPIKAHLRAAGLMVEAEWVVGDPAAEILSAAERLQPDLIALATHGRSGLDRLRNGSVAESVLRHARVPVMTFGPQALRRLRSGAGVLAAETRLPELAFHT